jgi:hypothetical protein
MNGKETIELDVEYVTDDDEWDSLLEQQSDDDEEDGDWDE